MKIASFDQTVERSGDIKETKFKMSLNAHMANLLSNSIYSDKCLAVLREYSGNAYDAHVVAGRTDVPFRVSLPTRLSPNLIIRDFGNGMSPTEIEELFTTYGASSKRDSNDLIGCLGIGSKAGFAYTDAFNVSSYQQGNMWQYSCFKDETGMFSIALLVEGPTDEPDGVEISVPVHPQDVSQFREKAKILYTTFKVRPEIVFDDLNGHNPKLWDAYDKPAFSGKDWRIFEGASGRDSRVLAVQGNLSYPVNISELSSQGNFQMPTLVSRLTSSYSNDWVVLEFPLGELDIAASREALSYNPTTITNLQNRFVEISKSLEADLIKSIKAKMTFADFLTSLDSIARTFYSHDSSNFYKFMETNNVTFTENGVEKYPFVISAPTVSDPKATAKSYKVSSLDIAKMFDFKIFEVSEWMWDRCNNNNRSRIRDEHSSMSLTEVFKKELYFWDVSSHNLKQIILKCLPKPDGNYHLLEGDVKEIERFEELFGCKAIRVSTLISSLAKKPRTIRTGIPYHKWDLTKQKFKPHGKDILPTNAVYITYPVSVNDVTLPDSCLIHKSFMLPFMKNKELLLIKETHLPQGAVLYDDYLKAELTKLLPQAISTHQQEHYYDELPGWVSSFSISSKWKLPKDIKAVTEFASKRPNIPSNHSDLTACLDRVIPTWKDGQVTPHPLFNPTEIQKIESKYPLFFDFLDLTYRNFDANVVQHLNDYLKEKDI